MRAVVAGVLALSACGRIGFEASELSADATLDSTLGVDTAPPACTGPFQPPYRVISTSTAATEAGGAISDDRLELYFSRDTGTDVDIFVSARTAIDQPFGAPTIALSTMNDDDNPFLESDARRMWYQRGDSIATAVRAPGGGGGWVDEGLVPGLSIGNVDQAPTLSADGLTLYFSSDRPPLIGMVDLWRVERPSLTQPFGTPVQETVASTPSFDCCPQVSPNNSAVWFSSQREGPTEIWAAPRNADHSLGVATKLLDFDAPGALVDFDIFSSRDGATIGLSSDRADSQGHDLWLYERSCP